MNVSKSVLMLPARHLVSIMPTLVVISLVTGYFIDTAFLAPLILPIIMCMIYPSMIGFTLREIADFRESRLISVSLLLNFIAVPGIAYALGTISLTESPGFFAGIAVTSLLPTSAMTVAYTMLSNGNVNAAIRLTALSLVTGSFLAPWYLLIMVGRYVPVDLWLTFKTIALVIFIPLALGMITYNLLLRRMSREEFAASVKPILPGFSAWGALCIVFINVSSGSREIIGNLEDLVIAVSIQAVFYCANYVLAIAAARMARLSRQDGCTLVYSTVLRNLAIALGLSAAVFGTQAVLMVSLAFLFQPVLAAWFMRLNERHHLLG